MRVEVNEECECFEMRDAKDVLCDMQKIAKCGKNLYSYGDDALISSTWNSTSTLLHNHHLLTVITMPDISYEALAGAALVIVLAVGYQYLPKFDSTASASSSVGKSKKKNKKVKGTKAESAEEEADSGQGSSLETDKKVKKKAKGKPIEGGKASTNVPPPIKPESASISTSTPSFAEVAAEESDQGAVKVVNDKPKTLAQKIAPKNRKTKVDE